MSHMRVHTVDYGETLATIAYIYYGDPKLLGLIYQHNENKIPNPNQLVLGSKLVIPYSPHELGMMY